MTKPSTKYQQLQAEFEKACQDLKERRILIEQLRKEKEQAYHEGYQQGRADELIQRMNTKYEGGKRDG